MGEYTNSIIRLSFGFFFVFMAFNTTQTLESTILTDKTLAFSTLSTIYGFFTLTCCAAPKIVSYLGPRLGMFTGAIFYILLVVANMWPSYYTLIPASAGVGVGAAVLWTSQGIYMSRCAAREAASTGEPVDAVTGRFNGLFWTAFQFNGAVGLLLAAYLETIHTKVYYLFLGFAVAGSGGVAVLFTLRDAAPLSGGGGAPVSEDRAGLLAGEEAGGSLQKVSDDEGDAPAGASPKGDVTLWETLSLLGNSRTMVCLIPAILYNGCSLGFAQGAFTTVFAQATKDGAVTYQGLLPSQFVGYYGATFYLVNSAASFLWGKVVGRVGRLALFRFAAVAQAAWLALLAGVCWGWWAPAFGSGGAYALVFGSAVLFAACDSVLESQLPAMVQSPSLFPVERDRDAANSNLRMWQSLGYCLQFGLGSGLSGLGILGSAKYQALVLAPLLLAGFGGVFYCDAAVQRIDGGGKRAALD